MIKYKFISIITLLLFISCNKDNRTYNDNNKFSKQELTNDIKQLVALLYDNHPAPFEFITKEKFESFVQQQTELLKDSLTANEFYKIAAPIVEKIGCGHSLLRKPIDLTTDTIHFFLPYVIKTLGDKTYVTQQLEEDSIIIGSEIVEINNIPVSKINRDLENCFSGDGYNHSNKAFLRDKYFRFVYPYFYGFNNEYIIKYKNPSDSTEKTISLIQKGKLKKEIEQKLSFKILTEPNIAIIVIPTFSFYDNLSFFKTFIDNCFDTIQQQNIQNLIIDLRGNSGGDPYSTSFLLSHLSKKSISYFSTSTEKYSDLTKPINPVQKPYSGKTFCIIDGGCFSSTGHFCALAKYNKLATFIGNETGSTYSCNDNSQEFSLENTMLILKTAKTTFSVAVKGFPKDKGILPDYEVTPTIEDIINGKDVYIEKCIELVKGK